MDNNNEISTRIRTVREQANENLSEFSRNIDVPRSTLVGYESKSTIPATVLHTIAMKYDISEEWLLSGIGEMKKDSQEFDKSAYDWENNSHQQADKSAYKEVNNTLQQNDFLTSEKPTSLLNGEQAQPTEKIKTLSTKTAVTDSIESLALESTAPKFAELEEKIDGKLGELQKDLQNQINELKAAITKKSGGEKYAEEVHEAEAAYTADTTNETPETPYEESEETVELPLAENLAAGVPTEAFTTGETYAVPVRFLKKRKKYCVAKIKGTSMTEAGIADGSYVLLEINETPVSGEIVLARYSNRTTLKRLRQKADCSWELCYEDGSMATIDLSGHDWAVVGRFVAVV